MKKGVRKGKTTTQVGASKRKVNTIENQDIKEKLRINI